MAEGVWSDSSTVSGDEGALDAVPLPKYVIPRFVAEELRDLNGFASDELQSLALADLESYPLVLLIGEPGSGKSVAARSIARGQTAHFEDLRFHPDETIEGYIARIFEDGPPSVLVIDSLDEWAGSMPRLVRVLQNLVFPHVLGGMRLIATCRSADVHRSLQEALAALNRRLSGEGELLPFHFHLLPLRVSDAADYIESVGLDSEAVLGSLVDFGAEDLAANAGLLDLLCKTFSLDGTVIQNRTGLFESAVSRAMDLASKSVGGRLGSTIEVKRLSHVAGIVAALTQFSGKLAVAASGAPAPTDLSLEEILGDWGDANCTIEDATVVLDSALFAQIRNARTFAHKSLSSFLVAQFIVRANLSDSQVASLITTPEEIGVRSAIVTQLREASVWLLVMDSVRYSWLVDLDPYGISKYSKFLTSDELRASVAGSLLRHASNALEQRTWGDSYQGLACPQLPQLLREAFKRGDDSQILALWIARDTGSAGLLEELRDLVISEKSHVQVKRQALSILVDSGQAGLVADRVDDVLKADDRNELLGLLINGLWPKSWTAQNLVRVLKRPTPHFIGTYDMALKDIPKSISPENAAVVLDWCADQPTSNDVEDVYGGNWITELAKGTLQNLSPAEVLGISDSSARAFWLLLRGHKPIPLPLREWPGELALELLATIVRHCPDSDAAIFYLAYCSTEDDLQMLSIPTVEWMVEQIKITSGAERRNWFQMLQRRMNPLDNEAMEVAWSLRDLPGWEVFSSWFSAIEIDSEVAENMKRHAEFQSGHERANVRDAENQRVIVDRVTEFLAICDSEPAKFWEAVYWLDWNGLEIDTDLVGKAEKLMLGPDVCEAIEGACLRYLLSANVQNLPKFEPDITKRPLTAVCRSATTLVKRSPEMLDQLSDANWNAVIEPALTFPFRLINAELEGQLVKDLVNLLVERDPSRVKDVAIELLRKHDEAGRQFQGLDLLVELSEDLGSEIVREHLQRVTSVNRESLLRLAFRFDPAFALAECDQAISASDDVGEIASAFFLLSDEFPSQAGASFIQLADRSMELAQQVALSIAPTRRWHDSVFGGDPDQLARLYELWRLMFPTEEDVFLEGVHAVDPRDEAAEIRNALLTALVSEATVESVEAIRRLMGLHDDWDLAGSFVSARELLYRSNWSPVSGEELQLLVTERRSRVIRSVSELRDVTVEALDAIQGWLNGEIPQAFALWNADSIPGRPKDENTISDWYCHALRLLLNGRSIVINREVEITRGTGAGMGSRNDIRLDASGEGEILSVVIEVKGCWNRKLRDGVQDQLDVRYLTNAGLTHGIFLVVCFPANQILRPSTHCKHELQTLRNRIDGYLPTVKNDIAVVVHDATLPELLGAG